MKRVTIVCDGSSLGNGGANSRAAAVALLGYQGFWRAVGEYLGAATNQQAEIAAAAIGLDALREPCRVKILTDSRYVVETMCGNFKRKSNHDWWQRLDSAADGHRIEWEWVRGHAGHEIQDIVDKTARKLATLGRTDHEVLDEAAASAGVAEI
jgi:ribonuclease HI